MKQTRLYNVILPIWILVLFPPAWLIVIPGNLIIDCAVLLLTLAALKHTEKKHVLKRLWWKLWLLGFAADGVGVLWMLLGMLPVLSQYNVIDGGSGTGFYAMWEDSLAHIMHNPFAHPAAFVWTLASVAIAGLCIYFFDKRALRSCPLLTDRQQHVIALTMAVVTAPWTFFIPMY